MKTVSFRARLGVHALNIALLSGTMFTAPAVAQEALPTGGQVVAGSATIATNGPNMTINQSSDTMIANWKGFSIGADNSVTFNQPTAQSVALNRVIGQDPSTILGSLTANGQVFLINPNGIVIGKGGSVQSGGFVGSTLGMSDADFLNDQYRFTGAGGSIVNQGDLRGGVVALIAPRVSNGGTITGDTALAGGTDVTLDFNGDGLISVEVKGSTLATLVENKGLIQADGGLAILTAKGANDALKGVVNNTGVIEAGSIASRDGRIMLLGDMDHGQVNAGGTLQAGFVETSAKDVRIDDGLQVKTNGGEWLIDPNDFTIAASGGNISGATLSNNLANGNVTITTATQGTPGGNGDIHVNDTVSWSANTLTLRADRNINVNTAMNGSGTAGLALEFAQTDATGDYYVNAPVNLASTGSFSTKKGGAAAINYIIITSLGAAGSTTGTDLQGIKGNPSGNYVLGANIDATTTTLWNGGVGFNPIGDSTGARSFWGNFDGLGHIITNLTINRPTENHVGLFGTVSQANIRNVGLKGGVVIGRDEVGGLAGSIYSTTIKNVWTSSNITGRDFVGGLVSISNGNSSIINAFSTGDVTATGSFVGGLVGSNSGIIIYAYATGKVIGLSSVGGLVGRNILVNFFDVTNISRSFWNMEATGQQASGCGANTATVTCTATGLTTAQMKTSAPFIAAGWDFTNVWAIDPAINNGYPYLRATVAAAPPPPPPPPPPPVVVLAVNDFAGSFSTTTAPYQPTINLTGTGFSSVTEVRFTWTDPNGQTGTVVWNAALNNFGGGRFVVGASGTTATISPVLVAAGDPSGTYQWTVTFVAGAQTVTKNFAVAYTAVVVPPPPPPPPPVVPLSLTSGIGSSYSTGVSPYPKTFVLEGQGFAGITSITLTWTDRTGRTVTITRSAANNNFDGRFTVDPGGNTARLSTVLVDSDDPPGLYSWTITFNATGSQPVTRSFTVNYASPQLVPPVISGPVQGLASNNGWGSVSGNGTLNLNDIGIVDPTRLTMPGNATPEQLQAAEDYWEYAVLSSNVYRDGRETPELRGLIKASDSSSNFGDLNYQIETNAQSSDPYLSPNELGFYAETFVRMDGDNIVEVIIVFRGTENTTDWLNGNLSPTQERLARQYASSVSANYPGLKITSTGHSLGGALAKVAADQISGAAIVFNSSPRGSESSNVISIQEAGDPLNPLQGSDVIYNFGAGGARSEHSIFDLMQGMRKLVGK